MLNLAEMAQLLGTCGHTIYEWHKKGLVRGYPYNEGGACLYEAPLPDSPLASPERPFRRAKHNPGAAL
jgi:predicted site-specific integrase-resolvase